MRASSALIGPTAGKHMPLGLFFGQAAKADEKYQDPQKSSSKTGEGAFPAFSAGGAVVRLLTILSRIRRNMKRCLLGSMLALSVASPALATDLNPPASLPDPYFVDEVRLGGFVHSPFSPERTAGLISMPKSCSPSRGDPTISGGCPGRIWARPSILKARRVPIYAGLTWQYHLTQRVFGEASFGGSLNNGQLQDFTTPAMHWAATGSFGCQARWDMI